MSTATELAEQEALSAEAEPEDPELDDVNEDEAEREAERERAQEAEAEPEREPASDMLMERIGRDLDKEADRHSKAVVKIMGDQMGDLVPCPLCVTPGFVTVEPPRDFDPMQRHAVLLAMGEDAPPELKAHPKLYKCETCDGWGDLTTGSRKPTTQVEGCPDCGGKGFRDRDMDQAYADARGPETNGAPGNLAVLPGLPPVLGSTPTVTQGGYSFPLLPGAAPDACGRLAGHPLWGMDASAGGQ